jgi:glycosyltransferase involved in cell wall biosynthesis
MRERPYKVLALASHPVQYMAPIFRRLAVREEIDLRVAYCRLDGVEPVRDPEFEIDVRWDVPLLDGYDWMLVSHRDQRPLSPVPTFNRDLWRLVRKGRFDAVLCFTGYRNLAFWTAWLAARTSGAAFLFGTDAGSLVPRDASPWKTQFKKRFWPYLFALADQVIVPSSDSRDLMYSLGIPRERVTLTPYSVDNDWWTERSRSVDTNAVRAAWGVSDSDVVILYCAKLQSWKRPLDLLRAFGPVSRDAVLVYAGEGPMRRELEAEATRLGIKGRVRFLGFVNQSGLPDVYTSSDVMVLPSEYEPFAVVVNEAMCCGCPVVSSDHVGAARDLIAPVCAEFIFPCGDVERLTAILVKAVEDRSNLAALGRAYRARILDWSPKQNIEATVEAIRLAAARKVRRHRMP